MNSLACSHHKPVVRWSFTKGLPIHQDHVTLQLPLLDCWCLRRRYAMFGVTTGILWAYLGFVALVRHLILKRFMARTWRICRIFFTAVG